MKYLTSLFFLLIVSIASAQSEPEMADVMRANGKIYVVLGVALITMVGLITYLAILDKKVSKIKKSLEEK